MSLINEYFFKASGVKVNPECLVSFEELKFGDQYSFITYGFNQKATEIIVLQKYSKEVGVTRG